MADLGGMIVTGVEGNPLAVLAAQKGFSLHRIRSKCQLYWTDGRPVDSVIDEKITARYNMLLDKCAEAVHHMEDREAAKLVSLGERLETYADTGELALTGEERELLEWHFANLEYANATKMHNLSALDWDQDDPYEMQGDHCFVPGSNLRLVEPLLEGVPVFYGAEVKSVAHGDAAEGATVECADGRVFRADAALCTLPLGVLKAGDVRFSPPLPEEMQGAISRLGYGLLNKVVMLFSTCFWGNDADSFGRCATGGERGEAYLFYSFDGINGGHVLIALISGEAALAAEERTPKDNVQRVLNILRGVFQPQGIEVPTPIQSACTTWRKDRFARGSYSHVAVGASGADYDVLAKPPGRSLFVAGEHTTSKWPATMHGAFMTGLREAGNIARELRGRGEPPPAEKPASALQQVFAGGASPSIQAV